MNWFHYNWLYCRFDILALHREVHTLIMIGSNSIQSQTTMFQGVVTEPMIAIYLPSQGIKLPPGSARGDCVRCDALKALQSPAPAPPPPAPVNKDVNWSGRSWLDCEPHDLLPTQISWTWCRHTANTAVSLPALTAQLGAQGQTGLETGTVMTVMTVGLN